MSQESKSLTQLAAEFKVHRNTMKRWLKPILKDLNLSSKRKLLLPWQVEMIYKLLDNPNNDSEKNSDNIELAKEDYNIL
jgi:hypothetical protein